MFHLACLPDNCRSLADRWYLWSRGRDEKPVGVYSHETALSLFDLGDFDPADLHMIVPLTFRRNGPVPKGVVLHRGTISACLGGGLLFGCLFGGVI